MAEEQINIEILLQTAKSAKSVEELEDSIKDLKNAATQIGAGGEGFEKLVNQAGSLKRRIEDVEQSVDKASKGFKGLQNFVQIGTSIAAGFSIAEGAAGLLGDENEELTKTITKVTSAMAILNGLQEIRTALIEDTTIATRAMAAAQTLYTNITKAAIVQTKLFRIALISTGIGALVVAIGLLVANWDKLTAAIGNSTFMLKRRQKLLEAQSKLNKAQIDTIEKRIELLGDETKELDKLQKQRTKVAEDDIKKQKEIRDIQKKLLDETAKDYAESQAISSLPLIQATAGIKLYNWIFGVTEEDLAEVKTKLEETEGAYIDSQQKLADIEKEKTQNIINELERQKALEEAKGNEVVELERQILTEKVKLYKEGTEEYKDAQNDIKVFEAQVEKERTDKLKEEEEKRRELLKIATEKRLTLLQEQLVAQGEYYNRLSELRVAAGDSGTPGIIEDIQNLIEENRNFIKSVNDTNEPLDNLVKTFDLLSKNILTLTKRQSSLSSPQFINKLGELQRIYQSGALSTEQFEEAVKNLNKELLKGEGIDIAVARGDEFAKFYDKARERLVGVFLDGDREKFEGTINDLFTQFERRFEETEGFFEKQRVFTSILDGYVRAFDLLSANIQTGVSKDLETFFVTLRDKLILEDVIRYDETLPEELRKAFAGNEDGRLEIPLEIFTNPTAAKQIEKYGVDLERLRNGTEEYNKEYDKLLEYFIQQETILKSQEGAFKGLNKEQKELLTKDIEGLAKTQLDAFIKVVTVTTQLEDGIRGVSYQYQQLNKELLAQSRNVDLLVGTIESDFERITKDFDFSTLIDGGEFGLTTEQFESNIRVITDLLEKFGLDRVVIEKMTQEEQVRILELFGKKAKELNEETKKEIEQIWVDGFLSLYGELSNFIIAVSDRITESRIRNAELARDAEIRAIDEVEEAYNLQQQNLSNADKARLLKEKEFENQRDVIRKKSGKEIAELEMKNAMLQWELRLGEAISTTALNVIKALGQPPFPGTNVAAATLAGTLGGLQVATLFAQMPKMSDFQSFSTGGMVIGPGTSTSDSIPAFLSNGESVINAKSTQMFLPQLDMINKMGGGSPLIKGYNQGGVIQGGTPMVDTSGMEEIMMRMNDRPIRAYVVSTDITNAQHNDDTLKKRTTF